MPAEAHSAPDRVASESSPLRRVGRYELIAELASGGMAVVHLGRALDAGGLQRTLAIKCCHAHFRGDDDFRTMFLDEARLAARIHHPNVVATLDVCDDKELYLVMEYIEGDRLSALTKQASVRNARIPIPITLRIMLDTLSGLHAAHETLDDGGEPLHIVHRDVSPQNIMVGVDGTSRITDFGIAKALARATVTREGQTKGKLAYMAPEQHRGEATRQADVFAAGVVMWEALAGRRLYVGSTDAEIIHRILHVDAAAPSEITPGIPKEIDRILARALHRDCELRYATAADFAADLEDAGIRVAPAREVADYVAGSLAAPLAERRKILRQATRGRGAGSSASTAGSDAMAPVHVTASAPDLATPESSSRIRSAKPLPSAATGSASTASSENSPRGSGRYVRAAVIAVVAGIVIALGIRALRTDTPARAREPIAPSITSVSPGPSPQPAVVNAPVQHERVAPSVVPAAIVPPPAPPALAPETPTVRLARPEVRALQTTEPHGPSPRVPTTRSPRRPRHVDEPSPSNVEYDPTGL